MSEFQNAVRLFLDAKVGAAVDLADEFEVAVSTVLRWARGTARPHPRLQDQILKFICGEGMR